MQADKHTLIARVFAPPGRSNKSRLIGCCFIAPLRELISFYSIISCESPRNCQSSPPLLCLFCLSTLLFLHKETTNTRITINKHNFTRYWAEHACNFHKPTTTDWQRRTNRVINYTYCIAGLVNDTEKRTIYWVYSYTALALVSLTGSHPETVGDMSRVTLNFDVSKIPFVHL